MAKHDSKTVNKVCKMKSKGSSYKDIMKATGLTFNQVTYIIKENKVKIAKINLDNAYKEAKEAVSFANATIRRVKKMFGMRA